MITDGEGVRVPARVKSISMAAASAIRICTDLAILRIYVATTFTSVPRDIRLQNCFSDTLIAYVSIAKEPW